MTKTLQASLLGVIFGTAVGLAVIWSNRARTVEAHRETIAKKGAFLSAAIFAAEERIEANGREIAALQAEFGALQSRLAAADKANLRAATDPGITALSLAAFRAGLAHRYGSFYEGLGLSAAQIARFEDLLTAHQGEVYDLRSAALLNGLDRSDPALSALRQQEGDELRAAQVALLGDDGYRQLQEFESAGAVRSFVTKINLDIGWTDAPLTGAQTQQLAAVLVNASGGHPAGGPVDPETIDWNAALPQAQGILSPAQLAGLKTGIGFVEVDRLREQFFQHEPAAK